MNSTAWKFFWSCFLFVYYKNTRQSYSQKPEDITGSRPLATALRETRLLKHKPEKTADIARRHPWSGGGGGMEELPYTNKPYGYVPPQRVGFLRRFGVKTGTDFVHFGLE